MSNKEPSVNQFKYDKPSRKLWLDIEPPKHGGMIHDKEWDAWRNRLHYPVSAELDALLTDGQVLREDQFVPPCTCLPMCKQPFANGACRQRNQGNAIPLPQQTKQEYDQKFFIHEGIEFSKKINAQSEAYKTGAGFGYSCGLQDGMKLSAEQTNKVKQEDDPIKKAKVDLIWEMIMENQDSDDDTFTKQDIEADLYGWLEKIDPDSSKTKPVRQDKPERMRGKILCHLIDFRDSLNPNADSYKRSQLAEIINDLQTINHDPIPRR